MPGSPTRMARFLARTTSRGYRRERLLDVWSTRLDPAFTLEVREDLRSSDARWGRDTVMYLEGSDQPGCSVSLPNKRHGGVPPYDVVLTHGFLLDEKGVDKMSKSLGNVVSPDEIIRNSGADILRLWAAASDYADDVRFGPEIIKNFVETYRKLRNTLRWLLGSLHHFKETDGSVREHPARAADPARLVALDEVVRRGYAEFDYSGCSPRSLVMNAARPHSIRLAQTRSLRPIPR